jgi:hypothetical protein
VHRNKIILINNQSKRKLQFRIKNLNGKTMNEQKNYAMLLSMLNGTLKNFIIKINHKQRGAERAKRWKTTLECRLNEYCGKGKHLQHFTSTTWKSEKEISIPSSTWQLFFSHPQLSILLSSLLFHQNSATHSCVWVKK